MTVNLGYPLMHINEVSFMYSWEGPLEKDTATHSSILAWRISWTEELSRLLSMALQESDTTY